MPSWGMHLLTAKKVNEEINIKDYNSFLIGNIITDINNGHVVPNVSKKIPHKKTHYYSEKLNPKTGKIMHYDVEKFIEDNKKNITNPIVLGYITHLLTDLYWNGLTYEKHGIRNEKFEVIGLELNNGKKIIADGEERRRIKTNDFVIFTNYICNNEFLDIPKYNEQIYDMARVISSIDVTKEDIKKSIEYLKIRENGEDVLEKDYKIFTLEEMMENVDICVKEIVKYFKENKL